MSNLLELPYSAGIISQSFWLSELRTMVRLILSGTPADEIQKKCIDENLFGLTNAYRTKRVYQYIAKRAAQLDGPMMQLLISADLSTQKLINLVAILRLDRLFFEFMNDVYREKAILGQTEVTDADINAFFTAKAAQSDAVAAFSDASLGRLRQVYTVIIRDAGLISSQKRKRVLTPPLVDYALEQKLIADGDESILKAISGVA